MIQNTHGFIEYFDSVRRRTMNYVRTIPADRFDWSPREGELTCGDVVRHLAAAEKMFVGVVTDGQWRYPGHARVLASTLDEAVAFLETCHTESMTALRNLNDAELYQPPSIAQGSAGQNLALAHGDGRARNPSSQPVGCVSDTDGN